MTDAARGDRGTAAHFVCQYYARRLAVTAVTMAVLSWIVVQAPRAAADSVDNLRAGLMQARGASCPALRSDPLVQKVAENVNQSTDAWLNHTARAVPIPDAFPVLKDFRYPGSKATMLQGVGRIDADAIKGALIEGYNKIPDCSYTDYGASVIQNQPSGLFLAVVVLAGA